MDRQIANTYRSLSPERLLEIAAGPPEDLTDEAREALAAELQARGLLGADSVDPRRVADCPRHPDAKAPDVCTRCGDFLCAQCVAVRTPSGPWCDTCADRADVRRLHYAPVGRFLFLSLLSLGLYTTYWMYRYWRSVKEADRSDIWPLTRAIFGLLTFFWMVTDINKRTNATGKDVIGSMYPVAFLALNFVDRLPDPFWLLGLLTPLLVVPVLQRVAKVTPSAVKAQRDPWGARHAVAIVLCVLFWVLILYGMVLVEGYGGY